MTYHFTLQKILTARITTMDSSLFIYLELRMNRSTIQSQTAMPSSIKSLKLPALHQKLFYTNG